MNAVGHFEDVYKKVGNNLRVVKMGDITSDICGGTHVSSTKDIEQFKIVKFYTVGGGLYRIEAITSNEGVGKYLAVNIGVMKQKVDMMSQDLSSRKISNSEFDSIMNSISYDITLDNFRKLSDQ
ncbi:MAG: hypothetical protein K2M43_01905, partial [Mycoplasmoidaceae bacterium]|nr:hypothetical protein [Mycoplasmoidaceae bacterium]